MAESKPNKKFIYFEDNGDGTSTMTVSMPEEGIFKSLVFTMSMEEMFQAIFDEVPVETFESVDVDVIDIPDGVG